MKTKQPAMATLPDLNAPDEEGGGSFHEIQEPIIKLIDDYRRLNPVDGKKMTLKQFAERAGIPFANLTGIVNGHRWVARSQRDFIDKLTAILEIPVLQFYSMCGFIKAQDVVATQNLEKTLNLIHQQMSADQSASYRVPAKAAWDAWPVDAKLCFAMLYEAYTSKRLLQYAQIHVK